MEAESYPLNDIREETVPSSGVVSRQPSDPTLNNFSTTNPESHHHQHHSSPHPPQAHPHGRTRRLSTASHVSMDFFDPEGVNELKRTLTHDRKSLKGDLDGEKSKDPERGSMQSDSTLPVPSEGGFDLEKMIRTIIRRYVSTWRWFWLPRVAHSLDTRYQTRPSGNQASRTGRRVPRSLCPGYWF